MNSGSPASQRPGSCTPRQHASAADTAAVSVADVVHASHLPPMSSPRVMPADSSTSSVRRARSPGSASASGPVKSEIARIAMSSERPGNRTGKT